MTAQTSIEWADSTFNPWIGCTKVSPACEHCYAERDMATRLKVVEWGASKPRKRTSAANWRGPARWNRGDFRECGDCGWRGEIDTLVSDQCPSCSQHEHLEAARRRVFCASLADVFDNEVPLQWFVDLLDLIRTTPNLDWLLLTKRIGRARAALEGALDVVKDQQREYALYTWLINWIMGKPPANVWLGATTCNQAEADRDIPKLLALPARVRFVSIEPMLGAIDLTRILLGSGPAERWTGLKTINLTMNALRYTESFKWRGLDWVIAGGESGPRARPSSIHWFRSLRDQCAEAGVPFLFKQWGEWAPSRPYPAGKPGRFAFGDYEHASDRMIEVDSYPRQFTMFGARAHMERVGKRNAGRLIDGRAHSEFPKQEVTHG